MLRDLALHLSNNGNVNEQKRLIMPRSDSGVPKDWERNSDKPFNAQIVSMHTGKTCSGLFSIVKPFCFVTELSFESCLTGEMKEMDWPQMEFPKAEVVIVHFSSNEYFLPPFMDNMPKLRAIIVMN